jgi:hypothetical protein
VHLVWLVAGCVLTASPPGHGGQVAGRPAAAASPLAVVGDVGTALSLAPADLASLPRTRVGRPLVASQGPLRIVAPRDARGARSMRMLTRLEVVRLEK